MRVYKYDNLELLNAGIETLEGQGYKVLAVKIFIKYGKTVLDTHENYYVIVDRYSNDRFSKHNL